MGIEIQRLEMLASEFKEMLDEANTNVANLKVLFKESEIKNRNLLETVNNLSNELREAREKLSALNPTDEADLEAVEEKQVLETE